MLKKLKKRSEFSRNVITLLTGTSIAQAIPILISPVLTRIFTPSEFGLLAIYYSILVVLSSISSGKYELSILLPKRENNAKHLVYTTIYLSMLICCFLLVFIVFNIDIIIDLLKVKELEIWLYLMPLNLFFMSSFTALYYWNNRSKNYNSMARSRVVHSLTQAITNLLIGFTKFISNTGLIFGLFMGSMISFLYLYKISFTKLKRIDFDIYRSLYLLKKYKKFPLYKLPSVFIENISSQMPIVFLNIFFGPAVVGFYSFSQKIVRVPMSLIGSSIGDVFKQVASKQYNKEGECTKIFISTLKKLIYLATFPFILLFIFAPEIFAFVFGKDWYVAGEYIQILTPMFYMQFITSPLSNMFMIANKQNYDLMMQVVLSASVLIGLILGYFMYNDVKNVLIIFSSIYSFKYFVELFLSYRFTFKVCGY